MIFDVISVGSALVDAFVDTGVKEYNGKISFDAGDKVLINKIEFSVGGGGINTATSFASLGLKTGLIAKIGWGYNSQIVLNELKKRKVKFVGIKSKEHSGYSIILESNKRHRTILTFKGASNNLSFDELSLNKIKTKWIHLTSLGGKSFETQKKIVNYANRKGIKISFNPSSYQVKEGINSIKKIISCSEVLSLNLDEAKMLLGKNAKDLSKKLYSLGAKIIVITDGERKGEVYDGKFLYEFYPRKVDAVECTGAGDAFSSGFIVGLIKTKNVESAIKVGLANSQGVITKRGAGEGIIDWASAEKTIKSKEFKIVRRLGK